MEVNQLLKRISKLPTCTLHAPGGLPAIPGDLALPSDLIDFYTRCGGAAIFPGEPNSIEIVQPSAFVRSNPVIVRQPCEYDVSFNWFIIAQEPPQYVTIDLAPNRLGRCYDSFWDRHGLRGDCAIIALSFTELLQRLIQEGGPEYFWLKEGFTSYGDAYDDVPES